MEKLYFSQNAVGGIENVLPWREVCKTRTGESEWRTEPALCREGRRAPSLHLGTPSFLPPSLPFLQNGDQTRVPRGLGHFVCILTDILRFAAKRQSIKVLPLKRKRDGDKLSAEGRLERDLLSTRYHY